MMTSRRIQITADSVCDLPPRIAAEFGIRIIPTYVSIDGKSIPDDGESLDRQDFYERLPSFRTQPTTAAPSPGDAERFYRSALAAGADHIISIHVPEKLSGVLNVMRLGAESVAKHKITLVDSSQLTFGIGLQVWAAAEFARQTGDIDAILGRLEQVRRHTRVYAIIDSLEYLKRSGRVSSLIANVGSLLKIKPIIGVRDGDIHLIARQRTWTRAAARLRTLIRQQAPLDRLAILHTANRPGAETFLDSISDLAPADTLVIEVTPTLGTHIGPGSIGAATLCKNWRE